MSLEATPRELEVEAAGLIRAALTGDAFAIDRIVTRAHEDGVDWRSFATEVTYTAGVLLIVTLGSKARAAALVDGWLDSRVRIRMAAASFRISPAGRYAVQETAGAATFIAPSRRRRGPRLPELRALRAGLRLAG